MKVQDFPGGWYADAPREADITVIKSHPAGAGSEVFGWPVTSAITKVTFKSGHLCIEHTKDGKWQRHHTPGKGDVDANTWVIGEVGGRWYMGTTEFLRPGTPCKKLTRDNIGPHVKAKPLSTWQPKPGEWIGLMVSTLARDERRTGNERSAIVWVRWGENRTFDAQPAPDPEPTKPAPEPPPAPAPTPPVVTDPETRALLQALREELAHVAQRVDARLLEVLETVRAERPLEVDAKVFGTLRGKVGRPKA